MEEWWLDPWRGGEEACSSRHEVGEEAATMEWGERGHGHSDGDKAVCVGRARSSDAERGATSLYFIRWETPYVGRWPAQLARRIIIE